MSFAAVLLLVLVFGLLVFDWTSARGGNRRALFLQTLVFVAGAFFIAFPDRATELAHLVGIQRGVDFLLYPIVIWLVRESLISRRRRLEDEQRLVELTRALALFEARRIAPEGHSEGTSPQSEGRSAS